MRRIPSIALTLALAATVLSACGLQTSVKPQNDPAKDTTKKDATAQDATKKDEPKKNESKFKDVKPDFTLKFSLQSPASDNKEYIAAQIFRDYVEMQTNGKVKVELYPGAQLGAEREVFEAIKGGNIDMGTMTDGAFAGFVPEVSVVNMPYIFKSAPVAWDVLDGPFGKELSDLIYKKTTVRTLGIAENGFRSFSNSKRPIHKLEDLKDLKFRVMESPMYISMVNSLGAKAVPMAGGQELYSALQQHVVDGQENPLDIIYSFKIHEVQDYITVDQHTYGSAWLFVSDKTLNSLPPQYQAIIRDAGIIWKNNLQGPKEQVAIESFSLLKDKIKEVYPLPQDEKDRFREAAQPAVLDWYKKNIGNEWVDKIQKAVQDSEQKLYGK